MSDNEIIALYFSRDENAITQTAIKYGGKLSGLSFKILKSSEDSEECVSDTYLKAWNTIPPQKPSFLFAYLAKICRFFCFGKLDYGKAQKRNTHIVTLSDELMDCIPSRLTETLLSEQELKNILESFLRGLSEEKRLIFMRRYWFADSISEIATRLNVSQSKVKTTLLRTREKLKIHLDKDYLFNSANRLLNQNNDMLFASWSKDYDDVRVQISRLDENSKARIVSPQDTELYDMSLYSIPWADSMPIDKSTPHGSKYAAVGQFLFVNILRFPQCCSRFSFRKML